MEDSAPHNFTLLIARARERDRAALAEHLERLRQARVQPGSDYFRRVARWGRQVADALAYAHRERTIHRDIKPSNLLLDARDFVWITDFGLVRDKQLS